MSPIKYGLAEVAGDGGKILVLGWVCITLIAVQQSMPLSISSARLARWTSGNQLLGEITFKVHKKSLSS
jgi:hypothetical protein